jgi:hypothetical protein
MLRRGARGEEGPKLEPSGQVLVRLAGLKLDGPTQDHLVLKSRVQLCAGRHVQGLVCFGDDGRRVNETAACVG